MSRGGHRRVECGKSRREDPVHSTGPGEAYRLLCCDINNQQATLVLGKEHTVPKGNYTVEGVKDDGRIDHLVVVQLAQILHLGNPTLIVFEFVLLQT